MNANASFAVAYVIGLEEGYRGAPLELELGARGFDVQRSPGVLVGAEELLDPSVYDPSGAQVLMRRPLTRGEIGCTLAHRRAAGRMVEDRLDAALICEDDARPVGDWDAQSLPWDLLGESPTVITLFSHGRRTVVAPQPVREYGHGEQVWPVRTAPITATGYLINRAAAVKLSEPGPVRYVADWPPEFAARVRFLAVYPWLVRPAGDDLSTLEADRSGQPQVDGGSGTRKFARHLVAAGHITWLAHHRVFNNDYRAYAHHEFSRLVLGWRARRAGTPVVEGDPGAPLTI